MKCLLVWMFELVDANGMGQHLQPRAIASTKLSKFRTRKWCFKQWKAAQTTKFNVISVSSA
eukprot:453807-Pelagomonas_calceolata.AAC.4